MINRRTITSIAAVGICSLLLVYGTFIVLSHWQTLVPLGERYELWWINSSDGWSLVVPRGNGLVERELVQKVHRVGHTDDGYVVQRRDGVFILVPGNGEPRRLTETERQALLDRRISLRKTGSLKSDLLIRRYGWLFAVEVLLVAVGTLFAPRLRRRN